VWGSPQSKLLSSETGFKKSLSLKLDDFKHASSNTASTLNKARKMTDYDNAISILDMVNKKSRPTTTSTLSRV